MRLQRLPDLICKLPPPLGVDRDASAEQRVCRKDVAKRAMRLRLRVLRASFGLRARAPDHGGEAKVTEWRQGARFVTFGDVLCCLVHDAFTDVHAKVAAAGGPTSAEVLAAERDRVLALEGLSMRRMRALGLEVETEAQEGAIHKVYAATLIRGGWMRLLERRRQAIQERRSAEAPAPPKRGWF